MTSVLEIAADPLWFPHRWHASEGAVEFIRLTPEARSAATFLDDQNLGPLPRCKAPLRDLAAVLAPAAAPAHFIFHSAFCCSTLLARALDVPARIVALREPIVLNDLAAQAQRSPLPPGVLDAIVSLLTRAATAGEAVVIKPTNEANALMEPLLSVRPGARSLLLSSGLEDFLYSIVKKGMWGRLWARRVHEQMRPRKRRDPGLSEPDLLRQTDLQIAAMVWLMHRGEFIDLAGRFGNRVASLDSADLLADKAAALRRVMAFFGLEAAGEESGAIDRSNVFSAHSKEQGRAYDATARESEQATLQHAHGEEIAMVVHWAKAMADYLRIDDTLPRVCFTASRAA
ncbi:MAG: hypothetical protein H0T82_10755 [Sphingomonas sp.]|nr:hypothetical protein [Sphingomonas sp.]